jgi:hypothetical protein
MGFERQQCCRWGRALKGGGEIFLAFLVDLFSMKLCYLSLLHQSDLDELEDQCLFDGGLCHEMGLTQGDVVARSNGAQMGLRINVSLTWPLSRNGFNPGRCCYLLRWEKGVVGLFCVQRLKRGFERPGSLASLVCLFDG